MGTIAYMSPEQARGDELDARSDLFSMGAVLYEMATGKVPFDGKTSAVIFQGILSGSPVRPMNLNGAIPPKLEEAITKSLEKDRDMRYQTAAELRGDLKRIKRDLDSSRVRCASGSSIAAAPSVSSVSTVQPPPVESRKSGSRALIVTAAVAALALLAGLAIGRNFSGK